MEAYLRVQHGSGIEVHKAPRHAGKPLIKGRRLNSKLGDLAQNIVHGGKNDFKENIAKNFNQHMYGKPHSSVRGDG